MDNESGQSANQAFLSLEKHVTAPGDSHEQPDGVRHRTLGALIPRPQEPPDGGYGWVIVACVTVFNINTWGINATLSVFLAYYREHNTFSATNLEFAFLAGISFGCAFLVSPVATTVVKMYGTRSALAIGVALQTIGLLGASWVQDNELWELFLSQSLCAGLGIGFIFVASNGIVAQWFLKRRSFANGMASAGSGVGGVIYSLAVGVMIPSLGVPWTFRTLAIVSGSANAICVILFQDRNKIIGVSESAFDIHLLRRTEYMIISCFSFFSMLGYTTLLFSLATYATAVGLKIDQGVTVTAIFNVGQAVGRTSIGLLSDRLGRINIAAGSTLLAAIFSLLLWPFTGSSYGLLIFFAIVSGTFSGTFLATIAPVCGQVIGLKDVPSALNLAWLVVVLPSLFSEAISLAIIGASGGFLGTQMLNGFAYVVAACCMLVLRGWMVSTLDDAAHGEESALALHRSETGQGPSTPSGHVTWRRMITNCWRFRKV